MIWLNSNSHHYRAICILSKHEHKVFYAASQFGFGRLLQQRPHVQQCVLHGLGQSYRTRLLAALERWYGEVDVIAHGVVAHAISIWHHGAKAHDAVRLGGYLTVQREMFYFADCSRQPGFCQMIWLLSSLLCLTHSPLCLSLLPSQRDACLSFHTEFATLSFLFSDTVCLALSFGLTTQTGPYLTRRQLVVQGRGVGPVSEDSRQGQLLLHSHHLQTQQVSVYGLATYGLIGHAQLAMEGSHWLLCISLESSALDAHHVRVPSVGFHRVRQKFNFLCVLWERREERGNRNGLTAGKHIMGREENVI